MWGIWILLFAVSLQADSLDVRHREISLTHSSTFRIRNLGLSDKLEFVYPDGVTTTILYYPQSSPSRGRVMTTGEYREYIIDSVKFIDQGTYKVRNFWDKVTSSYALKVTAKMATFNRVAGETLTISLEGLIKEDVSLQFQSGNDSLLLVNGGNVLVNNQLEYMGRIQVTNYGIKLLNFNVSDVGTYSLFDHLKRIVAVIRVNLVDHHEGINAAPLMSLMLLGIPVGICCCCRKKICKSCYEKKENNGVVLNTTYTEQPVCPPGVPPAYNTPASPSQMYPVIGDSTVHPPPNPMIPQPPYGGQPGNNPAMYPAIPPSPNPAYPSVYPPAQPPQWNGAPYNAPPQANFAPVMYSAPNIPEQAQAPEISATTPMLPNPQPEVAHPPPVYSNVLNSSDSAFQYNPAIGKDTNTNFL